MSRSPQVGKAIIFHFGEAYPAPDAGTALTRIKSHPVVEILRHDDGPDGSDYNLAPLRQALEALERAEEAIKSARFERDRQIEALLSQGVKAATLARVSGLSPAMVGRIGTWGAFPGDDVTAPDAEGRTP